MNIYCEDNLEKMKEMDAESVDLIATDPPFCTGRDFGEYNDMWAYTTDREREYWDLGEDARVVVDAAYRVHGESMGAFMCFLAVRVLAMHRILKPTGSIYLHCDDTASHYIKVLMDSVFGANQFRNEIVWKRQTGSKNNIKNKAPRITDRIFHYANSGDSFYAPQYTDDISPRAQAEYRYQDKKGVYRCCSLEGRSENGYFYEYKGYNPPKRGWICSIEKMQEYDKENLLHFMVGRGWLIQKKSYLEDSKGVPVPDLWTDIEMIGARSLERTGYPTQKPIALYERIIKASTPEGGIVFDPFCGSGTTLVAARNLGRQYIGIDANPEAVKIAERRISENLA